jgi:pyruvate formate lyase activating enzyme
MQSGLIFNIQKYSVHDGPGIRTTVFLKGCPLDCPWCHNPESISRRREIIVLENRCIGCGECRLACRYGTAIPGDGGLPARNEICDLCGACVDACPTEARRVIGREMSVTELLHCVLADQAFYESSGGGVTFSGGEPLSQPEFLRDALESCQAHGVHTAVDTCGLARLEHLLAIAPFTGLFLYDLKFMNEAKHRRYTGVSNTLILSNLETLGRIHPRIWIRIPVIPGINDGDAELEASARFVAGIPGVRQVNLLPFHRTGLPKNTRLGRDHGMANVQPPTPAAMVRAAGIFSRHGLTAKTGG